MQSTVLKRMFLFSGFVFVAAFALSAHALTPVQYCEYLQAKTPGATEILNRTPTGPVIVNFAISTPGGSQWQCPGGSPYAPATGVHAASCTTPGIASGGGSQSARIFSIETEVIKSCVAGVFKVKTMTKMKAIVGCSGNSDCPGADDVWHCTSGDCT